MPKRVFRWGDDQLEYHYALQQAHGGTWLERAVWLRRAAGWAKRIHKQEQKKRLEELANRLVTRMGWSENARRRLIDAIRKEK